MRTNTRIFTLALAAQVVALALSGCALSASESSIATQSTGATTISHESTPSKPSASQSECSMDSPAGKQTYDRFTFWQLHGAPMYWYNEPQPQRFSEVIAGTNYAVRGKILSVEPGVPYKDGNLPETKFTIASSDGKKYSFLFTRGASPDCVLSDHTIPDAEFIFFLSSDSGSGYKCVTESYCIIGAAPDGAAGAQLMSQSDRGDGGIVGWPDARGLRGIDELWSYVQESTN